MPDPYADQAVLRGVAGYTRALDGGLESFSASAALGYGLGAGVVPELELWLEAPRGNKDGEVAHTVGGGASVNLRWYGLRTSHAQVWTEWGVGPVVYGQDFPPGGSRFNFSSHIGLGLAPVFDERSLQLGLSFRHVSNAGLFGDGNPGLDALYFSVGWAAPCCS